MLTSVIIFFTIASQTPVAHPDNTDKVKALLVACAAKMDVREFEALCADTVVITSYVRGDDRLFARNADAELGSFPLVQLSGSPRYIVTQRALRRNKPDQSSRALIKEFLSFVRGTNSHQIISGENISVGHVPAISGSGVTGRVVSNLEWGVLARRDDRGEFKITEVIVAGHL